MKQQTNSFFKGLSGFSRLSAAAKMQLIGSTLLILSLFLNWFSDIDVFRSGDTYTGLSGPLYLIGLNLMAVALVNIAMTLIKSANWKMLRNMSEVNLGKIQMAFGFGSMYLLILANSIYFSPQFGLNVLSKKSEIGALVAMIATVMICVGGYISFRKKFDIEQPEGLANAMEAAVERVAPGISQPSNELPPIRTTVNNAPLEATRPTSALAQNVAPVSAVRNDLPIAAVNGNTAVEETQTDEHGQAYSGSLRTGKTEYERSKAYESLKKMMLKDTLSPDQRRKEREKSLKENAFSANFGKNERPVAAAKSKPIGGIDDLLRQGKMKKEIEPVEAAPAKKTQMYRMDL